jgi:hypothetical protein
LLKSDSIYELIEELERRVRIVRSARIEASKRHKSEDNYYRFITIFYSIIVTVLSIRFALGIDELDATGNKKLSLLLLVLSVFVTLFTMYVSIKNSGEKVGRFQSNYMELTRLLAEIQIAIITYKKDGDTEIEKVSKDCLKFSKRYSSLLTQSENHEDIDYCRAVKREEDDIEKIKTAESKIKKYNFWKYFKRFVAFLSVPLLILMLFIFEYIITEFWKS